MRRIKPWIMAARTKTLWAAVAPVIIGAAMAFDDGVSHWPAALAALFGALMIQIGTNYANDYFDFKKGADSAGRLGPTRVTQAGLATPREMKVAIAAAFGIACLPGLYLAWRGGWPIVIIGLLSIAAGVLYTAGPCPLGYRGLGDLLVLIFFGPVAVGGTYYAQSLTINGAVLAAGIAPGLLSVAILTINNLRDIEGDSAAGKRTLVVRFGKQFGRYEYMFCLIAAAILPAFIIDARRAHPFAVLTILMLPFAIALIRKLSKPQSGAEFNAMLAATGKIEILYSALFSVGWLL